MSEHDQRTPEESASAIDELWVRLTPYQARLGKERDLTLSWLRALASDPGRPTLHQEVLTAFEGFSDVAVVLAGLAALNAAAERRPFDAPPRENGPAATAAKVARAALDALPPSAVTDPDIAGYLWINLANALRRLGPEQDAAAQEAYTEALGLAPDRGWWWFDLGVCHKWRGRFEAALTCSLKARARLGDLRPVLWNAALAATAMGDGDMAGGFWRDLGFDVKLTEKSALPIVEGSPKLRVRSPARPTGTGFDANEDKELFESLWVAPISPGHGVVQSAAFLDCPIDYGDTVLWDGAPVLREPRTFGVLEVLRRGEELKLPFVAILRPEDVELFTTFADGVQVFAQAVGTSVDGQALHYGKLILPKGVSPALVGAGLEQAHKSREFRVAIPKLYELGSDSARAGKEHQMWRSIERIAENRGYRKA